MVCIDIIITFRYTNLKTNKMRAITQITIREEGKAVTMFLTYNDNDNDYSFNPYPSVEAAVEFLSMSTNFYFPIKTDHYRHLVIQGRKTLKDEQVKL